MTCHVVSFDGALAMPMIGGWGMESFQSVLRAVGGGLGAKGLGLGWLVFGADAWGEGGRA